MIRRSIAICDGNAGENYLASGRPADALLSYRRALAIRQAIAKDTPGDLQSQRELGQSWVEIAGVQKTLGQTEESLDSLRDGAHIMEGILKLNADDTANRVKLAASRLELGKLLLQLRREQDALAAFEEAIPVWQAIPDPSADQLYDLACLHALCARPSETDKPDVHADLHARRAIECLRKAVDTGYHNLPHVKGDSDFDSIRDRPEFAAILADLALPAYPFQCVDP